MTGGFANALEERPDCCELRATGARYHVAGCKGIKPGEPAYVRMDVGPNRRQRRAAKAKARKQ